MRSHRNRTCHTDCRARLAGNSHRNSSSKGILGLRSSHSSLPMFCAFAFCNSAGFAFLAGRTAPRRKTVKNIALSKKPLTTARPKESTQRNLNPALRRDFKYFLVVLQLTQSENKKWTYDAELRRLQRWRCDLWKLHANGVKNSGAQCDVPAIQRSIACECQWCLHK
jgi:hypothetical protein